MGAKQNKIKQNKAKTKTKTKTKTKNTVRDKTYNNNNMYRE